MADNASDFIVKTQNTTFSNAVQAVIGRTSLIEFGVIKKIVAQGIVEVAVSVAKDSSDIRVLQCVLLQPSSSALMVDFVPQVDDKVLVFSPRRFDSDMFAKENNDFIINKNAIGYSPYTCLAILCNQFRPSDYKNNYIKLEAGNISLKNNGVLIGIKDNNSISIDTSKAKVSIDADGNISIDAQDGKLSIKNSQADLFQILNGMLQILNSSLATTGSPASHTVVPNQFQQQSTDLTNLMQ